MTLQPSNHPFQNTTRDELPKLHMEYVSFLQPIISATRGTLTSPWAPVVASSNMLKECDQFQFYV